MIIDVIFDGGKKVNAVVKGFTIKTDQDVQSGGTATAPDPFTVFLSSIATCAGFYTKSFCDQREISTDEIELKMETKYDSTVKMISNILISIQVPQSFPEKYENALIQAVGLCAVKRHLSEKIHFDTVVTR